MRVDYLILKILKNITFAPFLLYILCAYVALGSESPERECCDPKRVLPNPEPPPLQPPHLPPVIPTTTLSAPSVIPTGRSGSNIKTAIAILNCILARQLCFEDPSCSAILEIIPRVCGPVPVACSTVTVTKCQAALRTLQAFPFFRPTCLCKEPGIDPDCNYFRDFLFDHPCGFVLKKEKDPYPIDALPTCNHALSVCQQERKCIKLFEDFKIHCKVRENKCRMEDRDLCLEAWTNLRLSPMFGCICPNNHMKRRCDRIFSMVNHNPCVDDQTFSSSNLTLNPDYPVKKNKTYPSYPHYLYPSKNIPLALASHRPVTTDSQIILSKIFSLNNNNNYNNNHNIGIGTNFEHARKDIVMHMHIPSQENEQKQQQFTSSNEYYSDNNKIHRRIGINNGNENNYLSIAREMGIDESIHLRLLDENMGLVETPLIASPNSHYLHHPTTAIYPYNLTGFLGQTGGDANNNFIIENGSRGTSERESSLSIGENDMRIPFQSTCHTAMEACRDESSCLTSLQNVLMHCETHRCNRNACMESLQNFYRASHEDISLDVAFCLCKKTNSRYDTCMIAQEKLHPTCAQRPPESINIPTSNGVVYIPPPACNTIADLCKEDTECRLRLELYEQSCAIDSVTKKCAGKSSSCRSAILGILGTSLRTTCACQGVDQHQLYDCLGWQKLLWLNPCVVESQKDFHLKRLAELGLLTTSTTTTTTTTTTPIPTTTTTTTMAPRIEVIKPSTARSMEPPIESNYIDLPDTIPETIVQHRNSFGSINTTMIVGGPEEQLVAVLLTSDTTTQIEITSTTTVATTTVPMRYCVVQRAHQSDQYIAEGQSQRILLDDLECSELCTCGQGADPLALTCHVLCVPLAPCRTALAYYSHAAPAYQAFRGRCLCYSGRFICMRPPPGEYILPGGVFLLLGYSSTDEALLRPHTNLGVQDAVRALHHYLQKHINNETSCTLTLFNMTEENVILSARLPLDIKINPIELLRREKEQCTPVLDKIAQQINSQQKELTSHPLLSIFKMAEVQVIWPEISSSSTINNLPLKKIQLIAIVYAISWNFIYKIQCISCR